MRSHSQVNEPYLLDNYLTVFEHIPTPNFRVTNTIIRDSRGFLWFGTTGGLCRYDGYQIRNLWNESPRSSNILSMIRFNGDSILIGTGSGLWIFDARTERFHRFLTNAVFSEGRVNTIARDSAGTIWVGTSTMGLYAVHQPTGKTDHYSLKHGLSDNRITSLLLDKANNVWIGTLGGGVNVINKSLKSITHYRASASSARSGLSSDFINTLCQANNGEIWIGTRSGVDIISNGHIRQLKLPTPRSHTIWSLVHEPSAGGNGRIWISAAELGLLYFSDGTFTQFTVSGDVTRSMHSIRTLYLDPVASHGSNLLLWAGTRHGVNKIYLRRNAFSNLIRNKGEPQLNRGAVISFCTAQEGILWVGLWGGGLEGLKNINGIYKRIYHFERNPSDPLSIPNNDINSIVEDNDRNLWIGTNDGLALMNNERKIKKIFKHIDGDSTSIADNGISSMHKDRSGTIWISTDGGLSQLVKGSKHNSGSSTTDGIDYYFKNSLHQPFDAHHIGFNKVSFVIEDQYSNIWVATYGRGLNKLEANGGFTRFTYPADSVGDKENFIYTVTENKEGMFWLSTLNGLVRFNPQTGVFTPFPISELKDVHLFDIVPNAQGELWLSTGNGLARYSPDTRTLVRYDEKDGIPFKELFSGFHEDANGKLFVGGVDGFSEFYPDRIPIASRPPEIAITSFSIFDTVLSAVQLTQDEIFLPYHKNFLSFSFAALDYTYPLRNRFAYKMEGVDKDWINAGTHNYTSYPNLEPGRYTFTVKGSNSDNVWNETGTSISVVILPPYWQTWWFRVLMAIMVFSIAYAAYRYRLRKLIEVERLRLRIADDLHDDVGSNLSTIAMIGRALQRAPELSEGTRKKLADIYDTALLTSEGMKDIVWFIKPENDTLESLFLRMKDTAAAILGDTRHEARWPDNSGSQQVTIEFKRNVFLAFKEILTNISKHASASKVEITVEVERNTLMMTIKDNGKGFNGSTCGHGNGLHSIQTRAKNLGGHCEIISGPGRGTTIIFSGKL